MANTVVTAPLVIAYAEDGTAHHLYKGSVLDDRFGSDEVKRLVDEGFAGDESTLEAVNVNADITAPVQPAGDGGSDDEGPPAKSANKPEWEAYAVSQGMSEEDASAATKEQLVDRYGG